MLVILIIPKVRLLNGKYIGPRIIEDNKFIYSKWSFVLELKEKKKEKEQNEYLRPILQVF